MHGTFKTIETKADPFSLDTLIAWLEKQPADKVYCYIDNGRCLLAQYFKEMGFKNALIGPYDFDCEGANSVKLPRHFNEISQRWDRTFGAALKRAREVSLAS